MSQTDFIIVMVLGGVFILLGIGALLWGKKEEKGYYNAISSHIDVREYMQHTPERPEPGGLKIGGIISIIIGLFILILGTSFHLCQ